MIQKIKIILAILLIVCTCLPLGSCEQKKIEIIEHASGEKSLRRLSAINEASTEGTKQKVTYLIPIKNFNFQEQDTWIGLFAFIWPLPLLITKRMFLRTKWRRRIASALELLFTAFSTFFIYSIVFKLWFKPMMAGYSAVISISIYLVLHVIEIITPILQLNRKNITIG